MLVLLLLLDDDEAANEAARASNAEGGAPAGARSEAAASAAQMPIPVPALRPEEKLVAPLRKPLPISEEAGAMAAPGAGPLVVVFGERRERA